MTDAIYLDNNSTTRPLPEVIAAMAAAAESAWANPSSVHRPGQEVRRVVELARKDLAALIGVPPRDLTLTGSGTESIDLVIRGVLAAVSRKKDAPPPVLVTSRVEHAAVVDLAGELERLGRATVKWIDLEPNTAGRVSLTSLESILQDLKDAGTPAALVSIQWANNETGTVQPVHDINTLCDAFNAVYHCDATQWTGKERDAALDQQASPADRLPPCDLLTASPHKFHGPKGVGVLWARRGVRLRPQTIGSQELGRRGGTENVVGIAGAAAAARAAIELMRDKQAWTAERARLAAERDRFESLVIAACTDRGVTPVIHANTQTDNTRTGNTQPAAPARLWNTTSIGFPGLEAEAILLAMSERGLAASAGAACSSGSLEPSPVLLAMGIEPRVAHGTVRFSISRFTTPDELDRAAAITADSVAALAGV